MSELGERYKQAEEMVLRRYAVEKDEKGRSQAWKVIAIQEDRRIKNDSTILKTFAVEVEATVDQLETAKPIVALLCKKACKPKPTVPHTLGDWMKNN